MQPTLESAKKRESLNIRIKAEARGLIDRAAKLRGKTRTDFNPGRGAAGCRRGSA